MVPHGERKEGHGAGVLFVGRLCAEQTNACSSKRLQFRRLSKVAQGKIQIVEPPETIDELLASRQKLGEARAGLANGRTQLHVHPQQFKIKSHQLPERVRALVLVTLRVCSWSPAGRACGVCVLGCGGVGVAGSTC